MHFIFFLILNDVRRVITTRLMLIINPFPTNDGLTQLTVSLFNERQQTNLTVG